MSYIRQYMQNARNFANESYLNADGFIDNDMQFTGTGDDFFNADGMPMAQTASTPTSQPYVINLVNASASAVSNFDVLGAYQYLQNTGFANGSLTISGITISSGIANVTYQQFLYQTMNSPFSVGLTYIQSATTGQLTQPLTLNTQDANGNQALKAIIVTIDPYQQQTSVVAVKQLYRIDGYTKLTISSVLASAVVQFQFYPSDNINLARGLAGRPASRQFGNPNIVKSSVAVIGGDTVQARLG
jgi:hypothetical protein